MSIRHSFHQRRLKSLGLIFAAGLLLVFTPGCLGISNADTANGPEQTLPQVDLSERPQMAQLVVYRTPTCGCCGVWVERMQAEGFEIQDNVVEVESLDQLKAQYGLPQNLQGCHSTVVGGYLVEGHVPGSDIQRLLTEKPDVVGITVPGMPVGSPGMESGNIVEPYASLTFDAAGNTTVFQEHGI